ncbi:MAG: DUF2786 domain-containing protein [Desulfobacteraceae bacterium]
MNTFKGKIQENLENRIVEKLAFEWDKNHWDLEKRNPRFAKMIQQPGIVLSDMTSTLGLWDQAAKEIRLSKELVLNGRWDSICEVLRHEMAHQLAAALPGGKDERPHGPVFIECCRALGANPKASGTYQTLEQRILHNSGDEDDRIMVKVKKLMSLASSENRHEAERAAAKANQLISRYNIDIIENDKTREFESIVITPPKIKRTQAEKLAAIILQDHYFVKTVWTSAYLPEKERMGKVLEISGTLSNVKIADYVFHYILTYAEKCWHDYKKENPSCRSRSGFMAGVVNGFSQKLDQQNAACEAQQKHAGNHMETAPVKVEDAKLSQYYHHRYPSISTSTIRCSSSSQAAYRSGESQGKQLTISRGIDSRGENRGRLIE